MANEREMFVYLSLDKYMVEVILAGLEPAASGLEGPRDIRFRHRTVHGREKVFRLFFMVYIPRFLPMIMILNGNYVIRIKKLCSDAVCSLSIVWGRG